MSQIAPLSLICESMLFGSSVTDGRKEKISMIETHLHMLTSVLKQECQLVKRNFHLDIRLTANWLTLIAKEV